MNTMTKVPLACTACHPRSVPASSTSCTPEVSKGPSRSSTKTLDGGAARKEVEAGLAFAYRAVRPLIFKNHQRGRGASMTEAHSNPEHVDVLIVGSGPAGSTYARVVGDARPDVSILVVEAGPRLRGSLGEHTSNMSPDDRRISQRLAQGPDADVDRPPFQV